MTASNGKLPQTAPEAARSHLARGEYTVPLPPRSKRCIRPEWPALRVTEAEIDTLFTPDGNIGVLLGEPSGGLVDVDLDCPEAIATAPYLLPETERVSGRQSAPQSHYWYVTDEPPGKAADEYLDPIGAPGTRAGLVELRSTGGMTVIPPSIYPAEPDKGHLHPEPCLWHRPGDPAHVGIAELRSAVGAVAAAALLGRYWPRGARHDAALALAGGLLRAGWPVERVERFLRAVCAAAGDPEVQDRLAALRDTAAAIAEGKKSTGWPTLEKLLGQPGTTIIRVVRVWLGVSGPTAQPRPGGPSISLPRYTPLPPWRPLPIEHLPIAVRAFVETVSRAMRCDPTFVALPALAACSGMIGSTRQIRLKRSWSEPAMIWAVVVGESGTLKTPPYKRAVAPVVALQAAQMKKHQAALESYRAEAREYERRKRKDKNNDPGDPPVEPQCPRHYSRDTTIEALSGLLVDNKTRFLIGRDELSGWLASFNQYKSKGGSDQANWLELHSLGTLCVDRKTGDPRTIFVNGVGVSLCGGIQPGVLRAALSPQHFSAGIPARLLFAYPPRRPKEWTEDDIDEAIEARYDALVQGLAGLEPHTDAEGEPYPVTLGLTAEAKAAWVEFYGRFAHKQAETDGDLAAAFSKLEGYAARLALVHHVCQSVAAGSDGVEAVGLSSIRAGIALAEWFTAEAERVYQMLGEETQEQQTRKLVEVVRRLAGRHDGRVTAKQLQRSNQRTYRSAEQAELALESLVTHDLGRWEEVPTGSRGGRPSRTFVPCVTCDETDETPGGDDSGDDGGDRRTDDDTGMCVTKPPEVGVDEMGVTPDSDGRTDQTSPQAGEVSSVSSHVTHDPPEQPHPDQSAESSGGFVTHGGEVSSPPPRTLVTDPAGVAQVADALRATRRVGLDIETTGLSHARDRARLLSLATPSGTFLVDLFQVDAAPLWQVLAGVEVVGHNLGFDLPFLMRLGFVPGPVADTMLASQVLDFSDFSVSHALQDVVHRHLGVTLDKELQTADWSGPLGEAHREYAARDAELPLTLWDRLSAPIAEAKLTAVADIEMAALRAIAWAAVKGVGFDRTAWEALAVENEARAQCLRDQLDAAAPNPGNLLGVTNWNSPEDVKVAFAARGLALDSTDDEALAALTHPVAELLREYRAASKLSGTYGQEWLRHVSPDGRVYGSWRPIGAGASGRMSCSKPNLQQLPRDVRFRRCFLAPPGRVLVKADYSQIELRIAAKITGDTRMLAAYRSNEDLHTLTAQALLGKSEVTKADRQLAKAVNFGLLYGQGAKGLARYARSNYGVALSEVEAAKHRETFFRTYPGLRAWHRSLPDGSLETRTLAGRRRGNVTAFT